MKPLRPTLITVSFALILGACANADDDAAATADDATATDAAAATDELFDTNFAQVCRETGQPAAAEYVAGPGTHPILVLRSDDGADFTTDSGTLPDGWVAQWPELESAQLVGCIVRTAAEPVEVCTGYEDEDSGLEWTVQTHNATYSYTVRNARTAEVLGSSTFEVPADGCPMFSMYSEGDPQPQPYYPPISQGEAEVFVRPFVTGS